MSFHLIVLPPYFSLMDSAYRSSRQFFRLSFFGIRTEGVVYANIIFIPWLFFSVFLSSVRKFICQHPLFIPCSSFTTLVGKSVQDVQSLYYNLKEKVFVGSRPYEAGPLEEILIKEFGEDTVMSTIKSPRVMVTSTLADRLPPDLHLFRNYQSPMSVLGEASNLFIFFFFSI